MEKVLLTIITASSGLCAVSPHAERQYYFIYDQKNLIEALSYCREKYTDLATLDTIEDVNYMTAMANLSQMIYTNYSYRAWIGLYDDVNSWRWSLSDTSFYKPGEAEFRNWSPGEPNNYGSGEYCTAMYSNGFWNDENCENTYFTVCSNVRGPSVTFFLTNAAMSWTKAQSYCRTYYTDLASVRSTTDNQMVVGLVPAGQKVWIGLFRDSWKWFDGGNSSFRYWKAATNEPNNSEKTETCVAADFSMFGQWEDWNCYYKRAFICYSVVPVSFKQVVKVRLETQSSSLNDPAVTEVILKQLKQTLKDKGVNGDIRLSWKKQSDGKVFLKEEENPPDEL